MYLRFLRALSMIQINSGSKIKNSFTPTAMGGGGGGGRGQVRWGSNFWNKFLMSSVYFQYVYRYSVKFQRFALKTKDGVDYT